MTRILTVARVTVMPEHEMEYIRLVQTLAELGVGRGQNLWLFKSADEAHVYLECSESRTEMSHRMRASRTGYEAKLEQRLQVIARYEPQASELWEEVLGPEPRTSSSWDQDSDTEDEGL